MPGMRIFLSFMLICCSTLALAQNNFEKYFTDKVLRLDFMLAGNYQKTVVYPAGMKEEPYWGGSPNSLIDPFNYGNFRYEVYDDATNTLIYSRAILHPFPGMADDR